MSAEAFGRKLSSLRVKRGVSLDEMSASTKLSVELWEAMERGDFSRWPKGLYARAYLRAYSNRVGLDADQVIDDFCRLMPDQGERRRGALVRGHAEIVGHEFSPPIDPLPPGVTQDRRRPAHVEAPSKTPDLRIVAAVADQALVIAGSAAVGLAEPKHFWLATAAIALIYHGVGMASFGASPAARVLRAYMTRHPKSHATRDDVFPTVPRTAGRGVKG
jgi:hypothetical protein